ncbi:MAG: DUF222 domain-containing protein [Acidimicrobiales bacterium]
MSVPTFDQCTNAELADTIVQLHELMCAVQREMLAAVAAYDRVEGWDEDGARSMGAWLAYRLAVSRRTGAEWARVATALEGLPALAAAFGDARLSFDQVSPLTKVATAGTEADLAEEAAGWTAAQCAAFARRAREVTAEEAEEAHRQRSLQWRWDENGRMLHLRGRLPDEGGAALVAALERIVDGYKPDPETGLYEPYEARAADALVELASGHLVAQASPDRATVVVHTDADGIAEIDGGPTIATETLRRMACDARVELVLHAADGRTVGVGRSRRTVPAWLVRQIRRRDQGCRFLGCERRRWAHAHHRVHWADGGPTDMGNLISLCPYHHRLVHERGWRIEGDPEGELTFIRPDGRPLGPRNLRR